MIALTAAFLLVTLVYVCTVTLVGALPNIISSPWYRDENRIMTMLPLVALPLLVIGVRMRFRVCRIRFFRSFCIFLLREE